MSQKELSENLNRWAYINRYSTWMYHTYEKYIGSKVFDVGAGMGRMVEYYIDSVEEAVATDIFHSQVNFMNQRFKEYPYFHADFVNILEDDLTKYKERFDTVICINVLEHLSDDYKAVANMRTLLLSGGRIILLVPAFSKLYCQMDKNVSHYRRYDPGRLEDIAEKNELRVIQHKYFNRLGIIPYWMKGKKKLKEDESFSSSLNQSSGKMYNIASAILEPIEKWIPPKKGISEIIILQK